MALRHAKINDLRIDETERKFQWPLGRRPDEHPGVERTGTLDTITGSSLLHHSRAIDETAAFNRWCSIEAC